MSLHIAEVVLKCVKELVEYLVFGLLAGFHIRVLLGVVRLSDIVNIKLARLVGVHNAVSFLADGHSASIHLASNASQELVVGDFTTAISVKDVECDASLIWMKTDSEVVHGFLEFFLVEGFVVVVVSDLEFFADASNSSCTSSCDLLLNVCEDLSLGCILGNAGFATLSTWGFALQYWWSVENVVVLLGSWLRSVIAGPALGAHALSRLLGKFPCIVHHGHEVHVIIDGATNIVVVLFEFFLGYDVVWCIIIAHSVSSLERLQKFLQDLILCLFTGLDIWVLVGLVDASDIVDVNPAIAVLVELFERLGNNLLSCHAHWTSDRADELVVGDRAAAVDIEVVEECANLTLVESKHEIIHGFAEFVFVE